MNNLEIVGNSSEIVSAILTAHNSCLEAGNKALLYAKQAGELLTQAKTAVKHGEWSGWVEKNLPFSLRTSQVYMKISGEWERLSNTQSSALLSINDAVKLLAEPKPEDPCKILEELLAEPKTDDPFFALGLIKATFPLFDALLSSPNLTLVQAAECKRLAESFADIAGRINLDAERELGKCLAARTEAVTQ